MKTMIFAAGMGTRLKPLTDIVPKALIPVSGKPLLQHALEHVATKSDDIVVINVHHHYRQITNFVDVTRQHWAGDIRISKEETLLETGGGIKHAAPLFVTEDPQRDQLPILIHNVDILSNINLREFYGKYKDNDDATLLVSWRKTSRYLIFDDDMRLSGWTNITTGEVRSPYTELQALQGTTLNRDFTAGGKGWHLRAFSGIHIFSPRLFLLMEQWPDRFPIMDFYLSVCDKCHIRGAVQDGLRIMDVGKLDTLCQAETFELNN